MAWFHVNIPPPGLSPWISLANPQTVRGEGIDLKSQRQKAEFHLLIGMNPIHVNMSQDLK
jgi:hypothetical protein